VFKDPADGSFYATPEFNGDKAEFEMFRGKDDGAGDGCNKDFADILKDHFAGVMTVEEFSAANEYAQREYRSFTGETEILPVEEINDVSSISADEVYILNSPAWKQSYIDSIKSKTEQPKGWKEYCQSILDEFLKDHGNVTYSNVYFGIEAGYVKGMSTEESKSFHDEIEALFVAAGWTYQPSTRSGISPTARKGKQSLYLHPMHFSGACLDCEIDVIERFLRLGKTFSYRVTDVYKRVLDMPDEEFTEQLDARRAEMTKDIQRVFITKRKNLFIVDYDTALRSVWKKYEVERLDRTHYDNERILAPFARGIFDELVKDGRIATSETRHGLGYRTAIQSKKEVA